MNEKWPYFSMGIMVGIIGVLATALAMSSGHMGATAAPNRNVDNLNGALIAGVGGMANGIHDMIYIVYKRQGGVDVPAGGGKGEGKGGAGDLGSPEERVTLALYKPPPRDVTNPTIELKSVREITWDLMLMQFNAPQGKAATVGDVIKAIREGKDKEDAKPNK
jgi:hypothetical protein